MIEKDDFEHWLASPMTQAVLAHFKDQASTIATGLQERLVNMTASTPQAWAEAQPHAAYLRGKADGFVEIATVTFEDFEEEADDQPQRDKPD